MDGHWPFISLRYLFISPSEQMFLGRDLTAHSSLRQRIAEKVKIYLSFLFVIAIVQKVEKKSSPFP
jgi:hypothetical protein